MQDVFKRTQEIIKEKDVQSLFDIFYPDGFKLTQGQRDIASAILFPDNNKVIISAHTQYGKTEIVARSLGIRLALKKTGILLLAPRNDQTQIIRNYLSRCVVSSPFLSSLADVSVDKNEISRLEKESSRTRQTFQNGSLYHTMTAHGNADRIMGHGDEADIVVEDEDCLITDEAQEKVGRLFASKQKKRDWLWIKMCNPWTTNSDTYKAWTSGDWKTIHIDYNQGIREGRTTKEFVEDERQRLPRMTFQVLYESVFPDQSEDALFPISAVDALPGVFGFEDEIKQIEKNISWYKKGNFYDEARDEEEKLGGFEQVVSCDPADKGVDSTVILQGWKKNNKYDVVRCFSEEKSENIDVARKIYRVAKEHSRLGIPTRIVVDGTGIGVGVVSSLRDMIDDEDFKVVDARFGERAEKSDHFVNRKAEEYFRARDVVVDGRVRCGFDIGVLRGELLALEWKQSQATRERIKVVDPDKSPDWADALVLFLWRDKRKQSGGFIFGVD